MADFIVTSPDGKKFRIGAPEGATEDQVLSYAQTQFDMQRMADPISGMSQADKFRAGVGKAFSDIGMGASRVFGFGYGATPEDVAERRKLDAPLMGTGAGVAGNVAGNITAFAPLAVVPGANTVAGAGAIGSTIAALQPTESLGQSLGNMAMGFGLAAGTQAAATTGARILGERAAAANRPLSVREQTLAQGQKEGYVVPPSAAQKPGWLTRRMESIAGKASLGQEAALRNQSVTDRLARVEAGLAPDEDITLRSLKAARDRMSGPYNEVSKLSEVAKNNLEIWKEQTKVAREGYKAYDRLPLPSLLRRAQRSEQSAELAHSIMEREAQAAGKTDLMDRLQEARRSIAKNYSIEKALNLGSGEVDASVIGRAYDRGQPMTGGMETIAKMQQSFKPYMREGGLIPTPGVSATEGFAGPAMAMAGAAATGHPAGAFAGGLPLLRSPVRGMLLSGPVQSSLVQQPSSSTVSTLTQPEVRDALTLAFRALGIPTLVTQNQ